VIASQENRVYIPLRQRIFKHAVWCSRSKFLHTYRRPCN